MKKIKPVFYDLFPKEQAMALTLKAILFEKVINTIEAKKLTPRQLEKILDVPQPRVSELLNQRFASMSMEKLVIYLEKLGVSATLSFKKQKAG